MGTSITKVKRFIFPTSLQIYSDFCVKNVAKKQTQETYKLLSTV